MAQEHKDGQQMQQTPKGTEIPVPKRGAFFGNLKKAFKPPAKPKDEKKP